MFKELFSEVNWRRILLVSVGVVILDFILNFLLLFLASDIWSGPAQARTAVSISAWTTYILLLLITFIAAYWVGSKVERETALNGALVGLIIGVLLFLLSRGFGANLLFDLVTVALNIAIGYFGGVFAGRGRATS